MNVRDSRVHNYPPRWNAAPSQELLVIRRNHQTGEVSLGALRWGLILYWCQDPKGGRRPIKPQMRDGAQAADFPRGVSPPAVQCTDRGFFEWKAIKGSEGQAAVCDRDERRSAVWARRHMGELERAGHGRVDWYVRGDHDA